MKKIRTITFHSSYNYGSCLQAYAMQEFTKRICEQDCDYKIINLRTNIQKKMYASIFEKKGLKYMLARGLYIKEKKQLNKKNELFEGFINDRLQLTREFCTFEELCDEKWDEDCYYLAGSDQLWNLQALDFDWAYYLEFVNKGKKISYAASWGPKSQTLNSEERERIKRNLSEFKYISVRENGSYNNVVDILGIKPTINVDPTLLLNKDEWEKIIPSERIIQGKYIFLYNLKGKEYVKLADKISKKLKLPVVVSKVGNVYEVFCGFKRKFDCGPAEFLNLIKNAEIVLSSSFHGTIFSIILEKPFFALKGNEDFRIKTLLEKMKLQDRSINFDDYTEKVRKAYDVEFTISKNLIKSEQIKSAEYLKEALDV